ncbi:MAG: helix-turn-helix transcriptional regulator [Caldicoprobacterales bacterium]|jgi:putative molybdopterin biosynthesis protein
MLVPKIKERRMEAYMSQTDLAKKTGIDPGQISQYETGKRLPRIEAAWKIAKAIGCHIDDLFEEE